MKRVIIAIFFIALSIYIGVYSLNETTKICNNMISRIETATEYNTDILENDNHDKRVEFYKKTVSLHDVWEENSKFFYFFFNIDVIENSSHQKRINFYKTTTELQVLWEKNSDFFYFFFNNDDIKELELNIEKIPEHAKNGDLETTYLCLVECMEELEYIKNSVKLNFDNVF